MYDESDGLTVRFNHSPRTKSKFRINGINMERNGMIDVVHILYVANSPIFNKFDCDFPNFNRKAKQGNQLKFVSVLVSLFGNRNLRGSDGTGHC